MPKVDLLKDLAIGGGAGVGSVDTIGIENFENTSAVDLPRGNDPFYLNGGTFQGELEDIVSNPASGEKHIRYTQAFGSGGDSFEMANFTIQPKEQDRFALIKFVGRAQGGLSGDIRFVAEDDNGDDTLLGTGFRTKLTSKFIPYTSLIKVPANATSISIGCLVENENIAATFEFDDVELTLDTFTQEALKDVQAYSISQNTNALTNRTNEIQFNLGTATITNNGESLIVAEDDTPNTRTRFVAQRKCTVTVTSSFPGQTNQMSVITKNGTIFQSGTSASTVNNITSVSTSIELEQGDYFTTGLAFNSKVFGGGSLPSLAVPADLTFIAEALSDHVVTPARSNMFDWTNADLTINNFGTVTNKNLSYKRVGDSLKVLGKFTSGVSVASLASIDLPVINGQQLEVDVEKLRSNTTEMVGTYIIGNASVSANNGVLLFSESTSTSKIYFSPSNTYQSTALDAYTLTNAFNITATGWDVSVEFEVPILGWTSEAQFLAAIPVQKTILIRHLVSGSGDGGSAAATTTQTRVLNDTSGDTEIASVASNQITLQAGTYEADIFAQGFLVGAHVCWLENVADSTDKPVLGSRAYAADSGQATNTRGKGKFTITSATTYELKHYTQSARATDGLGRGNAHAAPIDNVYAEVAITKIR